MLPRGTPDSSPPTLTLWVHPRRNSLIHTTTLVSTPDSAIFTSRRPWATKSKAFEKSTTIASTLSPLPRESAMSWHTMITWLSHEYPGLNSCCPSYFILPPCWSCTLPLTFCTAVFWPLLDGKFSPSNINLVTSQKIYTNCGQPGSWIWQHSFNNEPQPNNINTENGLFFKEVMETSYLLLEVMEKTFTLPPSVHSASSVSPVCWKFLLLPPALHLPPPPTALYHFP